MITADYLRKDYDNQCDEIGTCIVELHLISGEMFRVHNLDHIRDDYLLATVCPIEADDEEAGKREAELRSKNPSRAVRHDKVAIPFRQISYPRFTTRDEPKLPIMGIAAIRSDKGDTLLV